MTLFCIQDIDEWLRFDYVIYLIYFTTDNCFLHFAFRRPLYVLY